MRLGFKHFDISKRKFCITAWRYIDFVPVYKTNKDGTEIKENALGSFDLNILPVIRYCYELCNKSIYLSWLFWALEIEDETYKDTGYFEVESYV